MFIKNLQIYTQEDNNGENTTDEKNNNNPLKPGDMYRKHALSIVRELYDLASAELIGLILEQKTLVEDVPLRYEYWYKQARAKKDASLLESLEEDRKQVTVVVSGWKDRIGNLNERLLGFLLSTFELSEGSNTLRRETMEDIVRMFFELYRNAKQFEEGFQDALKPILKPKDITELNKMMKRKAFADNKDSKIFKAYKNKEKIKQSSLVKPEPGTISESDSDDNAMQDEHKLFSIRVNELQARISSAASTWAQQLDDQIDEILALYKSKTGLQQIITQFRNWRKKIAPTEIDIVAPFQSYLEEFKTVIDLKKSQLQDPQAALITLQNKHQDLEATLQLLIDDKFPGTKVKDAENELKRIEGEIKSLESKERVKVEERLLRFEKVVNRINRNFNAAVGYLTQNPTELSWATVYAALGLVAAEEEAEVLNLPKRQVSNRFEKSEIKIRENEPDEIDNDDELEIEYVKYGIQLSDLAPSIVKSEPTNSFHATDEVNTDDLMEISSNIVSSYKPMTLEGKKAKLIVVTLADIQERYDQLNPFTRPELNEYRAKALEDALFAWHTMGDEDITSTEARSRARQDVIQYMQSNNNAVPLLEEEEKKYPPPPIVKLETRKRPVDETNNIFNNIFRTSTYTNNSCS